MAAASLLSIITAGTAVAGTAYAINAGEKARSAQNQAQDQAQANATKAQAQADQANNAANPTKPDLAGNLSQLQQAAKGGPSGTMLTGPSGVDPSTLQLGKNTLLGS